LAWVFTTVSTGSSPCAGAIASSIARVSFEVEQRVDEERRPSPTISPALLHPQPPSGCR
jgi:hypothetical protein